MKEALERALQVLEYWDMHGKLHQPTEEAITAIKAALAQPAQQEPVAWMDIDEKGSASGLRYWSEPDNRHEVALYTTPPQRTWVGLTDREKSNLWLESRAAIPRFHTYATLAEAKLKEKNNGLL